MSYSVRIKTNKKMMGLLRALNDTGLFGHTIEETAERLISQQIQSIYTQTVRKEEVKATVETPALTQPDIGFYSVDDVIAYVATESRLRTEDIIGRSKIEGIVRPRQIVMWLCRRGFPGWSLSYIGQRCGARDHGTVLHSYRVIEGLRDVYPKFRERTDRMLEHVVGNTSEQLRAMPSLRNGMVRQLKLLRTAA